MREMVQIQNEKKIKMMSKMPHDKVGLERRAQVLGLGLLRLHGADVREILDVLLELRGLGRAIYLGTGRGWGDGREQA